MSGEGEGELSSIVLEVEERMPLSSKRCRFVDRSLGSLDHAVRRPDGF